MIHFPRPVEIPVPDNSRAALQTAQLTPLESPSLSSYSVGAVPSQPCCARPIRTPRLHRRLMTLGPSSRSASSASATEPRVPRPCAARLHGRPSTSASSQISPPQRNRSSRAHPRLLSHLFARARTRGKRHFDNVIFFPSHNLAHVYTHRHASEPSLAPFPRPPALLSRPRVAVVTLCDELLGDICAASVANKRAYADRHGYTLIVANALIDPSRPTAWTKILAVEMAMETHDLIFWTDIDTLIMNPNVRRGSLPCT